MTVTGFLYRRLLGHAAAADTRSGSPAAHDGIGRGPRRPEAAAAGPPAGPEAPPASPDPDASRERDARRRREIAELLPYARYLATRFGMAAGPYEDVQRVALQGLADAVDGFDPDGGLTLLAHAAAVIQHQVRRDLRTTARSMRPARRVEEVADGLPVAVRTLSRRLDRSPTVNEVALLLGTCPEDVVDALEVADGRSRASLGRPVSARADGGPPPGAGDAGIGHLPSADRLRPLLARLGSRDKQILLMRFLRGRAPPRSATHGESARRRSTGWSGRSLWVLRASQHGSAVGRPRRPGQGRPDTGGRRGLRVDPGPRAVRRRRCRDHHLRRRRGDGQHQYDQSRHGHADAAITARLATRQAVAGRSLLPGRPLPCAGTGGRDCPALHHRARYAGGDLCGALRNRGGMSDNGDRGPGGAEQRPDDMRRFNYSDDVYASAELRTGAPKDRLRIRPWIRGAPTPSVAGRVDARRCGADEPGDVLHHVAEPEVRALMAVSAWATTSSTRTSIRRPRSWSGAVCGCWPTCGTLPARTRRPARPRPGRAKPRCSRGSGREVPLAGPARGGGRPVGPAELRRRGPVQVCWEKFARYFDVEIRQVPLAGDRYVMTPEDAVALCDGDTIMVVATLGQTFTGLYEDVEAISAALDRLRRDKGLDVPLHVDAASGGFLAPFAAPGLAWDFRLERVKSINASGHKAGLAPLGSGWALWRGTTTCPRS